MIVLPPEGDVSAAARALAAATGREPVATRQQLAKGAPFVAALTGATAEAEALAGRLSAAGAEARALPVETLGTVPEPLEARSFEFQPDAFVARDRAGAEVRLAFADVALIVRARAESSSQSVIETTQKRLSRTGLALGLPIPVSRTTTERNETLSIEPFAVVYRLKPPAAVRLAREALDYRGLGEGRAPASFANYAELLRRLEAACPRARRDSRLERSAGRIPGVPLEARRSWRQASTRTKVTERTTSSGNAEAIAFAADLLFLLERSRRSPA